jgi:glucan endo-1,3-alpha-glucosidase
MTKFSNPSTFLPLIQQYHTNPSYYTYNSLPFVSTFNGGAASYTFGESSVSAGWDIHFKKALANQGINTYFVPDFDDAPNYPNGFFNSYPVVDGVMGWESAWPSASQGIANVSDATDAAAISAAHTASKTYMMRSSSPFNFHFLFPSNNHCLTL